MHLHVYTYMHNYMYRQTSNISCPIRKYTQKGFKPAHPTPCPSPTAPGGGPCMGWDGVGLDRAEWGGVGWGGVNNFWMYYYVHSGKGISDICLLIVYSHKRLYV